MSRRESSLKYRYGITIEQYEQMYQDQNGRCAICYEEQDVLCIDHCHKTGQIRSLLCHRCNRAIGAFQDNPILLNNAYLYLLHH